MVTIEDRVGQLENKVRTLEAEIGGLLQVLATVGALLDSPARMSDPGPVGIPEDPFPDGI